MAYEIIWTAEADTDLKNIVAYLKQEWSQQVAEKFIANTFSRLDGLAAHPSVARSTSRHATYMYKLDKKNVVFFLLEENFLVLLVSILTRRT